MLGDQDLTVPAKMLDFYSLQHKLIAHNIANAQVKDFHRLEASFDKEFFEAIQQGRIEDIKNAKFIVKEESRPGVSQETEVVNMTKNKLLFDAFAQIANFRLRMLRSAIGGQ